MVCTRKTIAPEALMRHFKILTITTIILLSGVSANAREPGLEFTISPSVFMWYGSTDYIMELSGTYEIDGGTNLIQTIKSELEFLLDATMVGIRFNLEKQPVNFLPWAVNAGIYINAGNPGSVMKDHDWESLTDYYDTKLALLRFYTKEPFYLSFLGGLRYQHIRQNIIGYDGWQRPYDEVNLQYLDPVPISGAEKGIFYKATYWLPQLGIQAGIAMHRNISLDTKLAYTRIIFSDFDDHLLRNKTAEADCYGNGFISKGGITVWLDTRRSGYKTFISLNYDLMILNADGNQVQRWYGDDGYTDPNTGQWVGMRTGDEYYGIPHEINSTQYGL